jgi:hypothetical protein
VQTGKIDRCSRRDRTGNSPSRHRGNRTARAPTSRPGPKRRASLGKCRIGASRRPITRTGPRNRGPCGRPVEVERRGRAARSRGRERPRRRPTRGRVPRMRLRQGGLTSRPSSRADLDRRADPHRKARPGSQAPAGTRAPPHSHRGRPSRAPERGRASGNRSPVARCHNRTLPPGRAGRNRPSGLLGPGPRRRAATRRRAVRRRAVRHWAVRRRIVRGRAVRGLGVSPTAGPTGGPRCRSIPRRRLPARLRTGCGRCRGVVVRGRLDLVRGRLELQHRRMRAQRHGPATVAARSRRDRADPVRNGFLFFPLW